MANQLPVIDHYGILASISWNSREWTGDPTEQDLKASKYAFVQENAYMYESLNFGHELYPAEDDGYYIGYTPMFDKRPDKEKAATVSMVFFASRDYNTNTGSIVGFYGWPEFPGKNEGTGILEDFKRKTEHPLYQKYKEGNVRALPENIIYLKSPVIIDNDIANKHNLLPDGKKIGQQGFNYLTSENVYNLLALALQQNQEDKKLRTFIESHPLFMAPLREDTEIFNAVIGERINTLQGIAELEAKMQKQTPGLKQRISSYIERGAIASKVKELTGYKCLVCEALQSNPYSFKKSDGNYYIETHHVEPVSTLKKGTLGISNLITVCANHHRQLHYGNTKMLENTTQAFKFNIDGQVINIQKIKLD